VESTPKFTFVFRAEHEKGNYEIYLQKKKVAVSWFI
jgi:hypothetical protein